MAEEKHSNGAPKKKSEHKPTCGIVMPLSAMENYPAEHWKDVREILDVVIDGEGFISNLVSNANEVTIIHSTIIQNLYSNEIVICDVSGKNPNVMFELGMRVTFDKPTIIIKDDKTDYNFDTSPIEHIEYPKDLRHNLILEFQRKLAGKLNSTYKKSKTDSHYSPYIKHFGQYKIAQLEEKEVSSNEFILKELAEINKQLSVIRLESIEEKLDRNPFEDVRFNIIDKNKSMKTEGDLYKFFEKNFKVGIIAYYDIAKQVNNVFKCIAGFPSTQSFWKFQNICADNNLIVTEFEKLEYSESSS